MFTYREGIDSVFPGGIQVPGGTHRRSAGLTPQCFPPAPAKVLVDPDVSEGAGVPDYCRAFCLGSAGAVCGIYTRFVTYRLAP